MKNIISYYIILLISLNLFNPTLSFANNSLIVYPAPEGALLNSDFTVKVRESGKKWQTIPNHLIKVDEVRGTRHHVEEASMAFST